MTSVVLIDAGRSAVLPDDPDLPETPASLTEDLVAALLRRTSLGRSELSELFLADPRCLSTGCSAAEDGWDFALPPLGLTTTVSMKSPQSLARAVRTIERKPEVVAVVAAADFGTPDGDSSAELRRKQELAREVAARADIGADEMADWARSSYTRSAECSAAGDFAAEIVAAASGCFVDRFRKPAALDAFTSGARAEEEPVVTAHPARGASAVILASEPNAIALGLRFRARIKLTPTVGPAAESGVAPLDPPEIEQLLAPCGAGIGCLDQLEVPEQCAVTPLAWIKATGISEYLVNPRGGDLAFGRLPRSGHLRSLVTMLHSLEATGGRIGALLASDARGTAAFVLSIADAIA